MVAIVPGDSADDANITEMLRGCDDDRAAVRRTRGRHRQTQIESNAAKTLARDCRAVPWRGVVL